MGNLINVGNPLKPNMAQTAVDFAWWRGQDGNIWVNANGKVTKASEAPTSTAKGITGVTIGGQYVPLSNSRQIADPNVPASNQSDGAYYYGRGGSGSGSGSGGSGSSAAEEAIKNNMRNIYDRQIEDIKGNEASLSGQLDNALAGVKNEYNTYKNEQQSAYDANKNTYDTSTLQNKQNLRTNRNEITDRASTGLRGILRVLGAMGAGGGSEARYEIPRIVVDQANAEYGNAGQTYAQNQQNLDTDWGNYKNQFENDKKKLEDWYSGQVKAKKQENC